MITVTGTFPCRFARLTSVRAAHEVELAAGRLAHKLRGLDISRLPLSEYNRRYLSGKIKEIDAHLRREGYLLALSLPPGDCSLERLTFLEYGGGTGLQAMLARELGIGTVIYNDIYDVSCRDARIIAGEVAAKADHYVLGDINDVYAYSTRHKLTFDIVTSYDVIEHIYDIQDFFRRLRALPGRSTRICLASGANPFLRKYVRKVTKIHHEHEYCDRVKKRGHKERDTLRAFLSIRREMIRELAQSLSVDQVEELAIRTRGLAGQDIDRAVQTYVERGTMSDPPDDPTNTCDPYTGNWAEHLMNPFELAEGLAGTGFRAEVYCGYCSVRINSRRMCLENSMKNMIMSISPRLGLRFAPYYILFAERRC